LKIEKISSPLVGERVGVRGTNVSSSLVGEDKSEG